MTLAAVWAATGGLRHSLPDPSWPLFFLVYAGMLGSWLVMIGLVGVGRRYLNRPSPALSYLAEASYPVYIIHQTAIVLVAAYLVTLPGGGAVQWAAVLIAGIAMTFGLYEAIRRVPPLRFLFGMKPRPVPLEVAE